ncbi:MAG: bifunctional ADP-dependent (S)-NAD(P)H-hydrate dehydratase/NAD(P)H-hydrate epimerase [Tepidiforma sp.]|nr:MAG: bifunctional ADP-dependent (S)-NAD(P)H-hydrate dehydratase/NAD(P)H-hydrate epimerase [Tepidiforma sp.]
MKLVTAAEMRQLEAAAIAAGSTEAQLMEEAGLAVAQESWMLLGTLEGRQILVLAGPGNNGGDGLVAARHLYDWGAEVAVYLPAGHREPGRLEELRAREIPIIDGAQDPAGEQLSTRLPAADLVIDALLGIGQRLPLDPSSPIGRALAALAATRSSYQPPKIVAVDVPTGLDSDTGAVDPLLVRPDMTVTFGLPKVGMYQAPGSDAVGRVQVIDIGIPKQALDAVSLELVTSRWVRQQLPRRPADANKGTFGRVMVVGGSRRYRGAVLLAAVGAYRAGAGLVTIAAPDDIIPGLVPAIPEATWLPLPGSPDGSLAGEAARQLRSEWAGARAAVFGPGLSLTDDTRALAWAALPDTADCTGGVVVDADALNALAAMDDAPQRLHPRAVLTPHPGEMARLLRTTVPGVQADRLAAARTAAARFGCVVVLKGAHTVIAEPSGQAALSPFANPLLATAGSGDVLAGIIAGYLAQGADPFTAARLGVYLHAAVAEALEAEYGRAGLLASEIAARLPRVVRDLTQS